MKGQAFFISPDGKLIPVKDTHISNIVKYPDKFGLSKEYVEKIYKKHKEPVGSELNAREEILLELVQNGWVRIREYPNKFWSVQINQMNKRMKDILFDFANKAISGKKPFKSSIWDNEIIKIVALRDKKTWSFSFKDVSNDILFSEAVSVGIPDVERIMLEVCDIEKYKPKFISFKDFIKL